jgi:hypothetical protein
MTQGSKSGCEKTSVGANYGYISAPPLAAGFWPFEVQAGAAELYSVGE